MRVDFYQLSRDPVERVVPALAQKALDSGARLSLACADKARRAQLSDALWAQPGTFLAHGEKDAERQPILLGAEPGTANGATIAVLADGAWREGLAGFERAILLFAPEQTGAARGLWTQLSSEGHDLRIFKQQDNGGWREGR